MHPSYKRIYERVIQLESDLATAEQDSRQKQARIERLEAVVKELRQSASDALTDFVGPYGEDRLRAALKNTEDV